MDGLNAALALGAGTVLLLGVISGFVRNQARPRGDQPLAARHLLVFVPGLAFNRTTAMREDAWHEHIQEAIGRFFDIPIFIFFGAVLPWQAWLDLGWAGVALAVLILALRRLRRSCRGRCCHRCAAARDPAQRLVRADRQRRAVLCDRGSPPGRAR